MEEIENPQSLIKTHYEQMLFEEKEWSYYWLDHKFAFLHTVFQHLSGDSFMFLQRFLYM